jgi:multisubunit Na+/H+ antiporter MnhG subunit
MAAIGRTMIAFLLVPLLVIVALATNPVWRFTSVFERFDSPVPLRAVGAALVLVGLGLPF